MACQPALMAPGAMAQASSISWVGSRIAAMAAWARANAAVSSNGAVPISCWSACATRLTMVLIDLYPQEVSAAMERSARFVIVLLLRHLGTAEFTENRDRLFAVSVDPIDTYAVVGVGVLRDVEYIGRSVVVKFHSQGIRREDVVGDVAAPLSGNVFICGRVGDVCRQCPTRK